LGKVGRLGVGVGPRVNPMRLTVRGVPKGALRTHSAEQAPLWGSLVTCVVYCLRVRQC